MNDCKNCGTWLEPLVDDSEFCSPECETEYNLPITASHEAAHAVACLHLGVKIESVTIEPTPQSLGAVVSLPRGDCVDDLIAEMAASFVGGMTAGQRGTQGDDKHVDEICDRLRKAGRDPSGPRASAHNLASRLTNERREAIDKLARELLIRKTMTGEEVESLLRGLV